MTTPRFFIHVSAATVEDMIEASERHGAFVEARAYLPPSGRGVYGSVRRQGTGSVAVKAPGFECWRWDETEEAAVAAGGAP